MKKFFASLLLSSLLLANTQAGVVLVLEGSFNTVGRIFSPKIGIPMIVVGAGLGVTAFFLGSGNLAPTLFFLEQNQDQIDQSLLERYTFIDNQEVLTNLSSKIIEKAADGKATREGLLINLGKNEVAEILAPLDLTADQMSFITNDLI